MSNDNKMNNAQQEWDAQEPDDKDDEEDPCILSGFHVFRPFSTKCKHCGAERDDY